jgi:two-component system cell cycle response regulator DivK
VLRNAGFRTIHASSGGDGLTLAAQHVPDVVLLDLRLPDMDGADVARTLRDGPQTHEIRVVALSALPRPGDEAELRSTGFAGYLEKPLTVATFPDQVRQYCGRDASIPPTGKQTS